MTPLIVKIGGSLAETGRLASVLSIVAQARRPLVLVPGGGVYADAVRAAQRADGFSDAQAHRRAILAMHRMAQDMADMQPRLVGARTQSEIENGCRRGSIPVWLPLRMVEKDGSIPQDWTVTSDGLAAWLSLRLGRVPVVLLKSCRVRRSASAEALTRAGIVDPVFAEIVRRSGLLWRILGPHELMDLRRLVGA